MVTSPPYYGLRDYGTDPQVWGGSPDCDHEWVEQTYYREGGASGGKRENFTAAGEENAKRVKETRWKTNSTCSKCGSWLGEFGQEPTHTLYVEHMVLLFSEVWRVLKSSGTVWLNLGDSYAANGIPGQSNLEALGQKYRGGGKKRDEVAKPRKQCSEGLKPKDLMLIPQRVAIALQDAGWWVRSEIVWAKPNPMPESVTDRPTRSHEQIWLLTKSERYWYDHKAVSEPSVIGYNGSLFDKGKTASAREHLAPVSTKERVGANFKPQISEDRKPLHSERHSRHRSSVPGGQDLRSEPGSTRNLRDVWTVPTKPYPAAHFAVFPSEIPSRCIRAGCPPDGTVVDLFTGSGTTLYVAQELGRKAIGFELNPEYCKLAFERCKQLTIFSA
ncbi:MAG TPA: site-specific DNA-methyltransferase [Trichocoleus sp.]